MAAAAEVSATRLPLEILGDAHGSAAVVPTTAAPEVIHQLPPGASAANTRVRSNSRTPDRGRIPDRGRASSRSSLQIVTMFLQSSSARTLRSSAALRAWLRQRRLRFHVQALPKQHRSCWRLYRNYNSKSTRSTATSCVSRWIF